MSLLHRYDTKERRHFLLEKHYTFKLKPRLLYVGLLEKQPGWQEEPHSHDFCEVVFISDGRGLVTVDGKEYAVCKGDLLVYNANSTHFEISDNADPLEMKFLAFDKLEITDLPKNWLLPPAYGNVFHTGELKATFSTYFEMLIREFENKDSFYVEVGQNMARTLLMYLFRLINQTENTEKLLSSNKILETAESFINDRFSEDISLDDVAAACYANKYYLSHLFSESKGMSIGKYILKKKIERAKVLLLGSNMTVSEVSASLGLSEASYFCRIFKKETGKTPLAYKKENQ